MRPALRRTRLRFGLYVVSLLPFWSLRRFQDGNIIDNLFLWGRRSFVQQLFFIWFGLGYLGWSFDFIVCLLLQEHPNNCLKFNYVMFMFLKNLFFFIDCFSINILNIISLWLVYSILSLKLLPNILRCRISNCLGNIISFMIRHLNIVRILFRIIINFILLIILNLLIEITLDNTRWSRPKYFI